MLCIDLTSPPTRVDLETEKKRLLVRRKKLIQASLAADVLHGSAFLLLYLVELLTGPGLLIAIVMATVVALIFASRQRQTLQKMSRWLLGLTVVGLMAAIGFLLWSPLQQSIPGSIGAALISGSIVAGGAIFGSQLLQTLMGLENLKTFVDDDQAQQELQWLCQEFPFLFAYRQQATQNLRPNLTYLELKTMRDWAEAQPITFHPGPN